MLTASIEKLSAGTKVAIVNPRYNVSRNTTMVGINNRYVLEGTIHYVGRYSSYARGGAGGVTVADYQHIAKSENYVWKPLTDKKTRDYGFWVKYVNEHGQESYVVAVPARILSTWAEYDDYNSNRVAREAQAQAKREAEVELSRKRDELKTEARKQTEGNILARAEALRASIPKTMVSLLGARASNVDYSIHPNADYVERDGGFEYVAKEYGSVRIPVSALQVLLELALVGKENN